jgi:hypothetical protein
VGGLPVRGFGVESVFEDPAVPAFFWYSGSSIAEQRLRVERGHFKIPQTSHAEARSVVSVRRWLGARLLLEGNTLPVEYPGLTFQSLSDTYRTLNLRRASHLRIFKTEEGAHK